MKTILIIGAQGTGKTTKAHELTKDIDSLYVAEINAEYCIDALSGPFQAVDYKKVFIVEGVNSFFDLDFIIKMIGDLELLIITSQVLKKEDCDGLDNLEIIEL